MPAIPGQDEGAIGVDSDAPENLNTSVPTGSQKRKRSSSWHRPAANGNGPRCDAASHGGSCLKGTDLTDQQISRIRNSPLPDLEPRRRVG